MKRSYPQAVFFDFDGVLVDSLSIKLDAFYELFKGFDGNDVEKVIEYHRQHGGISRVVKIEYAFNEVFQVPLPEGRLEELAQHYSDLVVEKVVAAAWINGAKLTLDALHGNVPLFLISGTPEDELNLVVEQRGMTHYFDEVLGSPVKKPDHIRALCAQYGIVPEQSVFIGDAYTDYNAALECNMKFIGIQGEVQFPSSVTVLPDCTELIEVIRNL